MRRSVSSKSLYRNTTVYPEAVTSFIQTPTSGSCLGLCGSTEGLYREAGFRDWVYRGFISGI